jgi:hypothetical protein
MIFLILVQEFLETKKISETHAKKFSLLPPKAKKKVKFFCRYGWSRCRLPSVILTSILQEMSKPIKEKSIVQQFNFSHRRTFLILLSSCGLSYPYYRNLPFKLVFHQLDIFKCQERQLFCSRQLLSNYKILVQRVLGGLQKKMLDSSSRSWKLS